MGNGKGWAVDLGTTNTAVAAWDRAAGEPTLLELPAISRQPDAEDPLQAPRMVPSAVHLVEEPRLADRLGAWPPLRRTLFLGRTAVIGRQALERNRGVARPAFVPTFKHALAEDALRVLARVGRRTFTARQVARAFLRELLAEVKRATGERIRDLTVTVPVSAFETYRAELQQIAQSVGVRRLRFADEPVAAALGYGLSLAHERTVLVVDLGGGTMHVALLRLTPAKAVAGQARVLGKQVRPLGGNTVDGWVLEEFCQRVGWPLAGTPNDDDLRFWRRLMLAEACRVKEAVFFDQEASFLLTPPGVIGSLSANAPGSTLVSLTRDRLAEILTANGFYGELEECVEGALGRDVSRPIPEDEVDDVLMVGGSTLLPGVFPFFEERFGRRRIRAWHPFEAVAMGAAVFAAERFAQADFIVHDYAFLTHDPATGEPRHTVIVPRGTRFPTRPDLWKRQVVPTCSLGEPETLFKLVICEISRAEGSDRRFVWDASGDLHTVGGDVPTDPEVIVALNESSPTLGFLDPPHQPGDRRPRLEVAFGVNEDRWLVATVTDLFTRRQLMRSEPVVRLL